MIPTFDAAVATLSSAESKEAEERGKAAGTVFQALWKAAEPLFVEGVPVPNVCPVCATPVADTAAGSAEAIREHIAKHLEELADYAAAKKALDEARSAATKAHTQLVAALPALIGLLGDSEAALKTDLIAYQAGVAGWPQSAAPSSADIVAAIANLLGALDQAITHIESKQGDHTYIKAKAKIDRLQELQAERDLGLRTRDELVKLSDALTAQAGSWTEDGHCTKILSIDQYGFFGEGRTCETVNTRLTKNTAPSGIEYIAKVTARCQPDGPLIAGKVQTFVFRRYKGNLTVTTK